AHGPYIQIIEEPKQRGFRFRYECEGPSHGGLPGASSERNRRTYPTVKVSNYVGIARVEVQLVTHSDPPQVHAHSLVGRQCCAESGMCSVDIGPNDLTAQFSNLGILHVTKRGVVEVLTKRLRDEKKRQRGTHYHFTDAEEQAIVREAKELGKVMDLNIVRLKFTAYLQDSNGGFSRALKPVVSNPIYDSKSPNASNLKISRMDKTCGSVLGGDEIFLLCDKVQKDDIEIRFYEEDDGSWEAYGDFSPTDVHKQYAIVFKTPPYHSTEIERPVTVFLQLKRKKGGDCSDPKQFTYVPQVQDKEEVQRKKQKPLPYNDQWRGAGPLDTYAGSRMTTGTRELQLDCVVPLSKHGAQRSLCSHFRSPHRPLHLAIIHQQSAVIQQLVHTLQNMRQDRVLNQLNHLSQSPLHLAVITGQVKVVDVLLRAGADPTLLDQDGRTALHLAALTGDDTTLRVLLGHLGERYSHLVNTADYHGLYPLHLAVRKGGERCLRLLVEGGAKINAPEQKSGCSALHLAVKENLFKVACTLITELKADVNMVTFGGNTPLHLAASQGSPPLCSMLIAAGADKNVENDEPLFFSSSSSDEEQEEEPIRQFKGLEINEPPNTSAAERAPVNPRKRPATGHTPFDLAKCQKVRNLLDSRQSPKPSQQPSKKPKPTEGEQMTAETLSKLCEVLRLSHVPWRQLAERLNMLSLAHLYQESPSPCHKLLENYQVSCVCVCARSELIQNSLVFVRACYEIQSKSIYPLCQSDQTVDSGFGSQPIEGLEEPPLANP
uniref:RHD domain-containing protein n=1 Tax=Esox lucius TaxID=8010 RepID=A0A3P8YP94_ESOLU